MTTTTSSLARAIAYLGAVEVAPGRYAYEQRPGRWFIGNAACIRATFEFDITGGFYIEDAEKSKAVAMPSWWTPEKRTTERVICPGCGLDCPYKYCAERIQNAEATDVDSEFLDAYVLHRERLGTKVCRITADLETGAEVPA